MLGGLAVYGLLIGGVSVAGGVVVAAAASLLSIWGLVKVVNILQIGEPPAATGVKLTLLAGILKFPAVALGLWLALVLSRGHFGLIGAAILLVYFCAVIVLWSRHRD